MPLLTSLTEELSNSSSIHFQKVHSLPTGNLTQKQPKNPRVKARRQQKDTTGDSTSKSYQKKKESKKLRKDSLETKKKLRKDSKKTCRKLRKKIWKTNKKLGQKSKSLSWNIKSPTKGNSKRPSGKISWESAWTSMIRTKALLTLKTPSLRLPKWWWLRQLMGILLLWRRQLPRTSTKLLTIHNLRRSTWATSPWNGTFETRLTIWRNIKRNKKNPLKLKIYTSFYFTFSIFTFNTL